MGQAQTKNKKKNRNRKNGLKLESKEEYFINNGGILLEKRIALSQGHDLNSGQVKIFSAEDIENATNCYERNVIVWRSVDCIVYKGILEGHVVAICTFRMEKPNPELVNYSLTEAATGMVMNHNNMVKLYGCCLETYIPVLVYEFMSNKNLFEHLHGSDAYNSSLKWADRLRIVTDVSYAVSYMHTALSKPVVHRDVQSHNILLGHSFIAKLASFGHSVSITPGESSCKWPVHGTPGYIDPEYVETREVTDKCDVYSVGVLLLEILTKRFPPTMEGDGSYVCSSLVNRVPTQHNWSSPISKGCGMNLVAVFVSSMEKNQVTEIIDTDVLNQASSNEIEQVTQLALACVAKEGVDRPTMVEVVSKLWQIQAQYSE